MMKKQAILLSMLTSACLSTALAAHHIKVVSCEFDPSAMSGNNASAHAFDQCQDQINPLIANDANGSSQGAIINVNTTVQDGKTYLVYTIASSVDATSK